MGVGIGIGISECPFSDPADYWRWVDLCEAGGVDSLWQTDRMVGPLPMLEALSVMAALAGRTRRLKFGMNVLSLAFRDPVLVAKQCATIDYLSEGRLLPAFGIGSPQAPEWDMLGIDARGRGTKTDEALDIIARLWRGETVDHDSRFFQLSSVSILPLPVQSKLPLWIGGGSKAAIRRTGRVGTGWIGGPERPDEVAPIIAGIKAAAHDVGRSIDHDHFGASFPVYFGPSDAPVVRHAETAYAKRTGRDPKGYFAVGGREVIVERIAAYVNAGASKFILRPFGADADEMLFQTRKIIDEILPATAARFS
jgi:probable F420-dependent oxidoreductase